MKAEINNENKAKFFGLYLNQLVLLHEPTSVISHVRPFYLSCPKNIDIHKLRLKSLSDISDEDAIACAKILDPDKSHGDWEQVLGVKDQFIDIFSPKLEESIDDINPFKFIQLSDFLRSRGYLVPWMGLSCEEIIEAGWVKYRKN